MMREMNEARRDRILRSGGFLWGSERVASGISITDLALAAKVNTGFISRMENGQMIPKGEEYQRIIAALKRLQDEKATGVVTMRDSFEAQLASVIADVRQGKEPSIKPAIQIAPPATITPSDTAVE